MTHKISLKQPRILINALASSLSILAAVVAVRSENPNAKTLSWIVAISSGAIAVANEGCFSLYEDDANNQMEGFLKPKDKKIAELTEEVETKRGIENQLRQQQSANKKLLYTVAILKAELEVSQGKTTEEKLFTKAVLDTFIVKIKELLNAHLEEIFEPLKKSVNVNMKRIKDEHMITSLNKIKSEIEVRYISYKDWIAEMERNENLDFVTDTIDIVNQIHDELASLRVKFIRTLGVSECFKLRDAVSKEKAKSTLAQFAETHKASYDDVMAKLKESEQVAANNDQYMQHIIAELEKAMERLAQKDEEIKALKRPQYWSTPTRDDQWIANIIINYFEKLGVILDRAHNDYDQWQATLNFHIDRNRRLIIAKDLNKHSDKIEQLANTLNTPEFKFNGELGLITVWVQIAKKPAEEKS
ncbi:MAG: hypothetical protein KME30_12135 [Iphinoe sp. HA4291-MV1]|jgi:hypothetical protein|nr:hypothetical protein [Iphinoe sp. HA4291-MV1]